MEPIVLRPGKVKSVLQLLASGVGTLVGVWMVWGEHTMGWFVLVAFGLGTIIFTVLLLPNASYLRVSKKGFDVRSLFRTHSIEWSDVTGFSVARVGGNKLVVFNYTDRGRRRDVGTVFATTITGVDGALPDTYGKSPEELAELMREWSAQCTSA